MNFTNEFKKGETLLRGINKHPDFWKVNENRPSSVAFKDKNGVSVNRTGENKECYEESLECLKNNIGERLRTVAELDADFCINLGLYLKYCPISENIYHSEIHMPDKSKTEVKDLRRQLAKACRVII